MFYIRTADRLQRTAAWIEAHGRRPGPPARGHRRRLARHRRRAGRGDGPARRRLRRRVAGHTGRSRTGCARFVSFVNAPDTPDPSITFTTERDQPVPGPVLVGAAMTGWTADLPVRAARARARRRRPGRRAPRSRSSAPTTATLLRDRQPRPVRRRARAVPRHRRHPGRRPDRRLAAAQAGLRPAHRRVPGRCRSVRGARPTRCGAATAWWRSRGRPDPGEPLTRAAGRLHGRDHRRPAPGRVRRAAGAPRRPGGARAGAADRADRRRRRAARRAPPTWSRRPPDDRGRHHRHRHARLARGGRGLGRGRRRCTAALGAGYLIARGAKARGAIRAAGLLDQWSPESESCEEVLAHLLAAGRGRRADRGPAARRRPARLRGGAAGGRRRGGRGAGLPLGCRRPTRRRCAG